jgi:hypothetical protein
MLIGRLSVFEKKTVEDIMAALDKDGSDWAKETKDTLLKMSPTALKITLEQIRLGAEKSIASCFKMEFAMVQQSLVSAHLSCNSRCTIFLMGYSVGGS